MKRTHKAIYAVAVLVAISSIAYAANAIRAAYLLVSTQQASAPTGTGITGKDRLWVKSSNDHLIFTNASNADTDISAGGGGITWARTAIADTAPTLTATSTAPQLGGYTSITVARTVTITQGGSSGTPFWYAVTDESGSANPTIKITVAASSGNVDGAASQVVIACAHGWWVGYCNGSNCFTQAASCPLVSWTAPTLLNSWVNFGAPYTTAGYWKDGAGIVHLKGTVKNGSSATATVLTLPAGFRPSETWQFDAYPASSVMLIDSGGNVSFSAGSTTAQIMDGFSFPAQQ